MTVVGDLAVADVRTGACGHPLTGRQLKWCSEACQKQAAREALLQLRFNSSTDDYDNILEEQGGKCPICEKRPGDKRFPMDHDHKTGLIRGIPCLNCNLIFIGKNRDPAKYRRAAEYLENPPARRVIGDRIAPGRPPNRRKKRSTTATRKPRRRFA